MPNSPYEMTLDLNVLKHLGINLYSNVAAVLSEAVANSWDADAQLVEINIDDKHKVITITDDGIGMSVLDMNNKYLKVGYCRREGENTSLTGKGRPVMGRKGLGKLSLFSIAGVVEIETIKDGEVRHGCRMSVSEIEQALKHKTASYEPAELKTFSFEAKHGTRITLKEVNSNRFQVTASALRVRLSRRFSVIGESFNFTVRVNGAPITVEDRDDLKTCEYIWPIGDATIDSKYGNEVQNSLANREDSWPEDWRVSGWIGTAAKPKDLDKAEGNLNGLIVLARGRLFQENVLDKINDGRLYTKYITGQIIADFLDKSDEPDIATSDRQRVQEADARFVALIAYLKKRLNEVERHWSAARSKKEVQNLVTSSPGVKNWLNTLKADTKKSAEKMLTQLSVLPLDNEEDRKNLYRHGILAFERIKLRDNTSRLEQEIVSVDKLLELLSDRDSLEASLYSDIVNSRLEAIRDLMDLVDAKKQEKILQKYLFDHLWLLDPSWERATNTEIMEKRLVDSGLKIADLQENEKLGRVDIAYRTISGKHVIIELKKADRIVTGGELYDQGSKYVSTMKKILDQQGIKNCPIEVIFVLGIQPSNVQPDQLSSLVSSVSPGSRIVYYDTLIRSAEQAYQQFLAARKEVDKLQRYLDDI